MPTAQIALPPKVIPVFQGCAKFRGLFGGRGSGKTRAMALMAAVRGYILGRAGISGIILCAREHLVNLDESSMAEVKAAILSVDWLAAYYEIGEKYIRSRDGRIRFAFTGLRNNLGGIKSKARILLVWVDEAEEVSEAAWSILIPTVRSEDESGEGWWQAEIWVSWNPGLATSATHRRFRESPPESSKIIELNYDDNPWFPEVLEQARLEDLKNRPETYSHIWEGAFYSITEAQVFHGKYSIRDFEVTAEMDGPYFGLDFGFAESPTAATESYILEKGGKKTLFVRRSFTQKKLELNHTVQKLTSHFPRIAMHTVRADSARPESISYLNNHGMAKVVGAKKGKGSVEDGIEYIKAFDEIVIHQDDATECASEFHLYSYKVDRLSGDILPVIVPTNDHCIDSLRYAHEPMIRHKAEPRLRSL